MGKRGYFITIEGPDGAGKSTLVRGLASCLKNAGYDVLQTREPGGTAISDKIRQILLDPENSGMSVKTEILLYAASRAQHVEELIIPATGAGKIVLCDRYIDSSIAYQGYGREMEIEFVKFINQWATGYLEPDLTILLDLKPEVGLSRVNKSGIRNSDRLEQESLEFHRRVWEGYRRIAAENPHRVRIVNAEGKAEETFAQAKKVLEERGFVL